MALDLPLSLFVHGGDGGLLVGVLVVEIEGGNSDGGGAAAVQARVGVTGRLRGLGGRESFSWQRTASTPVPLIFARVCNIASV